MRKSNSRFKALSGVNPSFFFFPLVLSLGVVACSNRAPLSGDLAKSQQATSNVTSERAWITLSDSIKESWIALRPLTGQPTAGLIRLNAKSCIEQKFIFSTSLSVLGQSYDIAFEEDDGGQAVALVEDAETKLTDLEIAQDIKNGICSAERDAIDGAIAIQNEQYDALSKAMLAAVAKLVPDCKSIDFDGKEAKCRLEALMPQAALVQTEEFTKAMIRKWSRQPYIIARRTGVVSTLGRIATNLSDDDGFAKFCRVLQFSIPEELPVVMTSRRWQSALCSGQGGLRREAAFYGLAKGTQELAMLRELYEGTSRTGLLSVRIPIDNIPGRAPDVSRQPLRVTIAPDSAVSQNLVDEAKKYLGRPDREEHPRRLSRYKRGGKSKKFLDVAALSTKDSSQAGKGAPRSDMCWHPVFGESLALLRTADGMRLTGGGFNLECGFIYERDGQENSELASLSKYLLQSLSSETEFVIDNGQSKLLRLPEGKYQYTVHVLPANPLDSEDVDEESAPKTSGELGWGASKNHAIKNW